MNHTTKLSVAVAAAVSTTLLGAVAIARPDHAKPQNNHNSMAITVTAQQGRLGVEVLQISPELRKRLGAPADRGVLVDGVRANSPAAKAGIEVGDVIVRLDGDAAGSASDMLNAMSDRKKGDTIEVDVIRDRSPVELRATLDNDGMVFRGFQNGKRFDVEPQTRDWFRQMPQLGNMQQFGDRALQKQLDQAETRIEQLERRLDRLEHRPPRT